MTMDAPLNALKRLVEAKTCDLRELATILGEDPATFYISTDLSGVDVRGQDLRGIDLSRTNIEMAIYDSSSVFDEETRQYLNLYRKKRYLEVSEKLLIFTEKFFAKEKFFSKGWFIKAIIPDAARAIRSDPEGWVRTIRASPKLKSYFKSSERRRIELIFSTNDYEAGQAVGGSFGGRGPALTALIVVGLLRLIGFDPSTDTVVPDERKWLSEFRAFEDNRKKFL